MLRDDIELIIKKYKLDKVYCVDGVLLDFNEVYEDFVGQVVSMVETIPDIVIYPAGNLGRDVADVLLEHDIHVRCMIDNNSYGFDYHNIPIITYDDFLLGNTDETTILLCSTNYSQQLYCSMILDGIKNDIVDIGMWFANRYKFMNKLNFRDIGNKHFEKIFTYDVINRLEIKISKCETIDVSEFKVLIYGLIVIKDFRSASYYTEKYKMLNIYQEYKKAISEMEQLIIAFANKLQCKDVMIIHVIDSLRDTNLEAMPFVKGIADNGLMISGIKTQYPYTSYAMNTLFTGKDVFDIDYNGDKVSFDDSELLKYIQENMTLSVASSNVNISDEFSDVMNNRGDEYGSLSLSYMLFEGLCLLEKNNNHHIILLHSYGEAHEPFYSIGSNEVIELNDDITFEKYVKRYDDAIKYIDKQIEWYFQFYQREGITNVIMGDHGISPKGNYNYRVGIKKDLPRCSKEDITSAFVVDIPRKCHVYGMVPATSEPCIIMDILNNNIDDMEKYCVDYTYIQQVPGYEKNFAFRFISRGIYAQYEGFIGVELDDEQYMLSASGRELYYRPKEFGYRNLIENKEYDWRINYCRSLLQFDKFPIKIYSNPKYKWHLKFLKVYDEQGYKIINKRLEEESK